ncbi:TPA: type VI secretion system protein TssA [Yersinia enterocolitica]
MFILNLDVEAMLAPIASDNPRGRNMEFDPAIDVIREARVSDPDDLPQDEWSTTLRKADWPQVIRLSQTLLSQESKDLQVVCWLAEALLNEHGLAGMATAFEFMQAFIQNYGDTCWPEPDDDGESLHDSKLQWLDRQLEQSLVRLPLLGQPESTLQYWRQVQDFEHKVAIYPKKREEIVLNEGDFSLHSFQRWAAGVSAMALTHTLQLLAQVRTALVSFEQQYQQHHVNVQCDKLSVTGQALVEIEVFLQRLVEQSTPDYDDIMMQNETGVGVQPITHIGEATISRQTMSRDLAISQMQTIALFFRKTEPSSPVPFLMERAARWANMTLTEWLEEMLQDDNSLRHINQVLMGSDLP